MPVVVMNNICQPTAVFKKAVSTGKPCDIAKLYDELTDGMILEAAENGEAPL